MALVEAPDVATLPTFFNPKQTSVPLKGSTDSTRAASITIQNAPKDLDSDLSGARTRFALEEHPVDTNRPIKVGIVGAGLAGVTAGVLLPAKLPGIDLRIFDKNADVVCQPIKR